MCAMERDNVQMKKEISALSEQLVEALINATAISKELSETHSVLEQTLDNQFGKRQPRSTTIVASSSSVCND